MGDTNEANVDAAVRSLRFVDVTVDAGLDSFVHRTGAFGKLWFPETVGAGCAFLDYDGDGWLDILLVAGGVWQDEENVPALELYRNDGDGTFERVTRKAGLEEIKGYAFGVAVGDYDNNGSPDVFVTMLDENILLQNDGGTFHDVSRRAGIDTRREWSTSALFFDADMDGHLDLYVGNYVAWTPETDIWCTMDGETKAYCTPQAYDGLVGRYYQNRGDGTFRDRTEAAGFSDSPGKTLGVAELDFNDDGRPDLVVSNDTERDLLYENKGNGTFLEVGVRRGIAYDENGRARAGMGIDTGDFDNSGRSSVVIGHFSNEMVGIYQSVGDYFVDRARAAGVGQPSLLTLTFGLFFFDADLDGYLDLLLANGHISEDIERVQDGIGFRQRAQLFLNREGSVFADATQDAGPAFEQRLVGRGAAYGDYDHDGDLDVLLTENGGRAYLWQNELRQASPALPSTRSGDVAENDQRTSLSVGSDSQQKTKGAEAPAYLRIHLEGRESNRDAYGSRVVAVAGDRRMTRRVRGGSSYLSQSEPDVTFGLRDASQVDSLIVYWPGGGVERWEDIPANQTIRIVEGDGTFATARTRKPQ